MNITLSEQQLFDAAIKAENMQHGQSSGLDLKVALRGGCLLVHGDELKSLPQPSFKLFLINTGKPTSSTGECVSRVASYFSDCEILNAFSAVTTQMACALETDNVAAVQVAIKQNHQLLVQIGVVPKTIQALISEIEMLAGAAKICGAGAVEGEQAGMVLAVVNDELALKKLCKQHGYDLMCVECESRGVHVV